MLRYLLRRLLLLLPTLWLIVTVNFFIIQLAPGGPVEQALARLEGIEEGSLQRIRGGSNEIGQQQKGESSYRASRGLDPQVIAAIEKQFGFDRPLWQRYLKLLKDYLTFQFGDSLFRSGNILQLIAQRLPVSISLGLWSTLLIYLISIPLGIAKALRHGSRFDLVSGLVVVVGYAIPAFLFAMALIIFFASGNYVNWFPLRGLVSAQFAQLPWYGKIADYFWHMTLPILAMVIGGFATLTMLSKNCFLEEIHKQYVVTARAKGLTERAILYRHVFRNAMLLIIAGFPSAFLSIFFTGSLLIEVMFSLNGLGLLGYEATIQRDYPLIFASLYIFTLLGLLLGIVGDLTYSLVDPRIDFEARG